MNRHFSKRIIVVLFSTLICSRAFNQIQPVGPGTAPVDPPTGGFAIDGFLGRQGAIGDWLEGPGGNLPGTFLLNEILSPLFVGASFTWISDRWNNNMDDIFSGNSRYDLDPNKLTWHSKKSNAKNDINNALICLVRDNTGDIWAIFAGDRFGTNGYSYLDFEFFQNTVIKTGGPIPGGSGGFTSIGPHDGRTVGDVIVSMALGDNGALNNAEVLQWQPGGAVGTFGFFPVTHNGAVYAATNTETIEVPFGAFGSSAYPPGTFAEAAINLTEIIGGTSAIPPDCATEIGIPFKTLWIKSKTSAYSNAKLIDFIDPLQFDPVNLTFAVSVTPIVLDNYTVELTASVFTGTVDDYFFFWSPDSDNPPGGSLSNNNTYSTIFTTTNPETCINYVYTLYAALKSDPNCSFAYNRIRIPLPCKIGKPINPDKMELRLNKEKEETNDKNQILVYPNPSKGNATVILPGSDEARDIDLLDIKGAVIQRWKGVTGNTIKLKNVQTGLYLLRVVSADGKVTTKKVLVQ